MASIALIAATVVGCQSAPIASPSSTPASSVPRTAPIRVDRTLLEHLPPELSGITVEYSAEASEDGSGSGALAGVESLAYAVAADEERADLAVATVLRPLASGLDEAAFRQIRDTYSAAACESEGGLRGNGEGEIGGRLVHIGTCAAGSHTYAAKLPRSGVIVLAFSRGEGRLGEQLMARLRDL